MTKSALLAAVSIFALCASSAFVASAPTVPFRDQFELLKAAKGAKVLYNQNSNYTCCAVPSVNYTSGSLTSYDSQAADDFVVPKGRLWKVGELDVFGAYGGGSGPAGSENVIFYRDTNGVPGGAVKNGEFLNLHGTEKSGSFVITLPNKGLKLSAGRYWISIVANMTFANGTWAWKVNGMQHGNQAMWQNPNGGIGRCQTWGTIEECEGSIGPDLMFELRGTSKQK